MNKPHAQRRSSQQLTSSSAARWPAQPAGRARPADPNAHRSSFRTTWMPLRPGRRTAPVLAARRQSVPGPAPAQQQPDPEPTRSSDSLVVMVREHLPPWVPFRDVPPASLAAWLGATGLALLFGVAALQRVITAPRRSEAEKRAEEAKRYQDDLLRVKGQVEEVQVAARRMQEKLRQQLKDRDQQLSSALKAAVALERELEAVKGVVRARENELAAVKAAASEQAAAAKAALKESQRKVALLEAMVVALRDRLQEEESRNSRLSTELAASQAQITAVEGQRAELVELVRQLQDELAATQLRLQQADSRADQLQAQVERLQAVEEALRARAEDAARKAEAAESAVTLAEEQLLQVQAEAQRAQQEVVALQQQVAARDGQIGELREQLVSVRQSAAQLEGALASKTAEAAEVRQRLQANADTLQAALRSKEQELARVTARLSTVQDQMDAEAKERQVQLEAELEAARLNAAAADRQLEEVVAQAARDEQQQAELQEAAEKLMAMVTEKEAELEATREQLEATVSRADADAVQRQQQLSEVQQRLEADLEATRRQAAASAAQLKELEAVAEERAARDEAAKAQMAEAAKQLLLAYEAKQQELDATRASLASMQEEADAETLAQQALLEAELEEARLKAEAAGGQLAEMAARLARDEELQVEMKEAAQQLADLVTSKEAELQATREQLQAALARVDEEAVERQQQLLAVQQQLEAQLRAAQREAASTRQEMDQLKEEMEGVVVGILSMAKGGAGALPNDALATLLPEGLLPEGQAAAGSVPQQVAALDDPGDLMMAAEEMRNREEALRAQVARLEAELELQCDLVAATMPPELLQRVGSLEASLAERRAALRPLQQLQLPERAEEVQAMRLEVEALEYEVQMAYRSQMGPEMRQRERNLRLELRDRGAELAAVLQGQATAQQRLRELQGMGAGVVAGGRGAAKVDVLQLVRQRLQDLEAVREDAVTMRLQQMAAREEELQDQLRENEEAYVAGLAAAEARLQQQIRDLEVEWRAEAEARQAASEEQAQEREQLATTSADQVQRQVLEMRQLQEELAAQESELRAMRDTYSSQVEAAQAAALAAQQQVVQLQRQASELQVALQKREEQGLEEEAPTTTTATLTLEPPAAPATTTTAPLNGNGYTPHSDTIFTRPASAAVSTTSYPPARPPSTPAPPAYPGDEPPSSSIPQPATNGVRAAPPTAAPPAEAGAEEAAPPEPLPSTPPSGYATATAWGAPAPNEAAEAIREADAAASTADKADGATSTTAEEAEQAGAASSSSSSSSSGTGKVPSIWDMLQRPAKDGSTGDRPGFPAPDDELAREVAAMTESFLSAIGLTPRASSPSAHRGPRASTDGPAQGLLESMMGGTSKVRAKALRLQCGAAIVPHVDKVAKGGEDAYFITSAGLGGMGVADGVGGWAEDGVDPAEYSRQLMAQCCRMVESSRGQQAAQRVLEAAQTRTRVVGSATACVALMRPGGVLEVANLGDSGLRVLRAGECVFRTAVQEHEFNMPYQLADPTTLPETDLAEDADVYKVEVQAGDLVVLGTDGLFDNMWEDELAALVAKERERLGEATPEAAKQLAEAVAKVAHRNGGDDSYKSPWSVEAAQAGMGSLASRMFPRGGKMDDTTVVVAFVEPSGRR